MEPIAGPFDLATPQSQHDEENKEEISTASEFAEDEIADRAFRAAVFGIIFCPMLFYGFFLALTSLRESLSPRGQIKVAAAFVITLSMIVLGTVVGNILFLEVDDYQMTTLKEL